MWFNICTWLHVCMLRTATLVRLLKPQLSFVSVKSVSLNFCNLYAFNVRFITGICWHLSLNAGV